jgi:hypothetical protein
VARRAQPRPRGRARPAGSDQEIVEGFRRQLAWFSPPQEGSAAAFALEHLVDVVYANLPYAGEGESAPEEHPRFPKKYAWLARQRLQFGRDLRVRQEAPGTAATTTVGARVGASAGEAVLEKAYQGWLASGQRLREVRVSQPVAMNMHPDEGTTLLGLPNSTRPR